MHKFWSLGLEFQVPVSVSKFHLGLRLDYITGFKAGPALSRCSCIGPRAMVFG